MIDRHWDGIAADRRLENKVSLGFVEGLNNKIRVIQRRAYGFATRTIYGSNPHLHAAGAIAAAHLPIVRTAVSGASSTNQIHA